MSQSGTDRAERGYRAANDALDERPSAATRAAILAAAARQVQAVPRDAASARVEPRRSSTLRWPLAAAASVLLSTLAVMMAVRTEQEMPSFTPGADVSESRQSAAAAPTASIPPDAASATPASKPTEAALSAGAPAPDAATAESKRALAKERAAAAPAPARESAAAAGEPTAAESQGDVKVTAPAELSRAPEAIAAPSAPASPAAATPARDAARSDERLAAKTEATQSMEDSSRRNEPAATTGALSALRQAPAPASALGAAGTARFQSDARNEAGARADSELRADDWLEKIIKLRAAGRHDEADAELKRFRERYPQVQVPPTALSATGTR